MEVRNFTFLGWPIYKKIRVLYKHYNRDVDITEKHTSEQKQQQFEFINLLGESPIIKKLHGFLVCKGMLSVRSLV